MVAKWRGLKSGVGRRWCRGQRRQRTSTLLVVVVVVVVLAGCSLTAYRPRLKRQLPLLTYDGDYGGLNNQIISLLVAVHLARQLKRAVRLPPVYCGGQPLTQTAWSDLLAWDATLDQHIHQRRPVSIDVPVTSTDIPSLQLHSDRECAPTLTRLRRRSAQLGRAPLHLGRLYGLMRCFSRSDAEFLRLWRWIQLRPPTDDLLRLPNDAFIDGDPKPLRIALHLRSSGFEAAAYHRRPRDFPAPTLPEWVLGISPTATLPDAHHASGVCASATEQRAALCQVCAIARRDIDLQPIHWFVMHDNRSESLRALRRLRRWIVTERACSSTADHLTELSPPRTAPYASLAGDMHFAVHHAHIFIGNPLSTVSSNIARWRAFAGWRPAPSLTYTGDLFLTAIPHLLGFH
ncbi:hypothetical protein CDCA_CDCA07G2249 [Cyanidium caldarium]|uniref:Uncharacterized protein n=1 Tax=Cyanidium caldarium TaxID=2771 RepID=A0AAV9IVQ9_CYACA|nr:hypothetical protein CDCA_CDCA07G2249 [Cyanidium caldarium]